MDTGAAKSVQSEESPKSPSAEDVLERISDLAQTFSSARELHEIYYALRNFTINSCPCSALIVSLYNSTKKERTLVYGWGDGEDVPVHETVSVPVGKGPSGQAIATGEVVIVNDYWNKLQTGPMVRVGPFTDPREPQSALVAPMIALGKPIGILEIQTYQSEAYTPEHASVVRLAANLAAIAIDGVRVLALERETEKRLLQAQRMEAVAHLAGGIAHDFNNLLTTIQGYCDLIVMGSDTGALDARQNALAIKQTASRAATLTMQLLAYSRQQFLQPEILDLNAVVLSVASVVPLMIGEQIEFRTSLASDLLRVSADANQIRQVLLNLTLNARDAMLDNGGTLLISTENASVYEATSGNEMPPDPGEFATITIGDTGLGIPSSELQHIFDPFFTTKKTGTGSGLCLSSAYGIVKQSGGHIFVTSQIGAGTQFTIFFPAAGPRKRGIQSTHSPHLQPQIDRPTRPNSTLSRGTETILLVEDDSDLRQLLKTVLTRSGYTVLEAINPFQAFASAQLHHGQIHLLLTDLVMPGLGGREFAKQFGKAFQETKVLFMSGYSQDSVFHQQLLNEGLAFLAKPFNPSELTARIRKVLSSTNEMLKNTQEE
jgi:hypothetical protein